MMAQGLQQYTEVSVNWRTRHSSAASRAAVPNAVLHVDETQAVEPLERTVQWEAGEAPETFPFGE
jgi:hypothetical protein